MAGNLSQNRLQMPEISFNFSQEGDAAASKVKSSKRKYKETNYTITQSNEVDVAEKSAFFIM